MGESFTYYGMDLHKMIVELQSERQRLDEAIEALERLSTGNLKRRGRPPRWLKDETEQNGSDGSDPAAKKKPS